MARRGNTIGRGEIGQRISDNQEAAAARKGEFEEAVDDVVWVEETWDSLDFSGTDEGASETESFLDEANDQATDIAEDRDEQLAEIREEGKETEAELDERIESDQSDREKLAEAEHRVAMQETLERVKLGLEAIQEDIAFLEEANERSAEIWDGFDRDLEGLRGRIRQRE
jgi:hypothetical protein